MLKLKLSLDPQHLVLKRQEFERQLNIFRAVFDQVNVPTLIWEKGGFIHYLNKAYVDLTGYTLPTDKPPYGLFEQFSAYSLKRVFYTLSGIMLDGVTSTAMLPCEWSVYGKYIDVIFCITIKRDSLGFPLILIGNVLPVIMSPAMGQQISAISQRPIEGQAIKVRDSYAIDSNNGI